MIADRGGVILHHRTTDTMFQSLQYHSVTSIYHQYLLLSDLTSYTCCLNLNMHRRKKGINVPFKQPYNIHQNNLQLLHIFEFHPISYGLGLSFHLQIFCLDDLFSQVTMFKQWRLFLSSQSVASRMEFDACITLIRNFQAVKSVNNNSTAFFYIMRGITKYFVDCILTILFIMVSALPADLSSSTRLECISVPAKNNVVLSY